MGTMVREYVNLEEVVIKRTFPTIFTVVYKRSIVVLALVSL